MTIFKRNKIWHARIKSQTGKDVTVTTKQTDRRAAARAAREAGLEELETAARTQQLTHEAVSRITAGRRITLAAALDAWRAWMTANRTPRTVDTFVPVVARWIHDMNMGSHAPASVTEKHVSDWVNNKRAKSKANTRRVYISMIGVFLDYCAIKGWMVGNPARLVTVNFDQLEHEQKETAERGTFTKAELHKLLSTAAEDPFWKFAILLGYETGLRLGDIAGLEWASFEKEGQVIVWTDKRNKRVAVPVSDQLTNMLPEIPVASDKHLFPDQREISRDMKRRAGLSVQFRRLAEKAGVEGKPFHCLRHTRISAWRHQFENEGLSYDAALLKIGKLVGHTSKKTTEGYVH
jgi:integrase